VQIIECGHQVIEHQVIESRITEGSLYFNIPSYCCNNDVFIIL